MTFERSAGSIGAAAPMEGYAVSPAQRRMWTIAELNPDSTEYSLPGGLLLSGALDRDALKTALAALVERHESLRTTFDMIGGDLCQFIHPRAQAALDEVDLRDERDATSAARALVEREAQRPFDLRRGPLFRVMLLTLAQEHFVLWYNLHHIITDEYSNGLIVRELSALYAAARSGRADPLPLLELQAKDIAAWQNELLAGPEAEDDKRYWLSRFAEPLPVLDLATEFPRPPVRTSAGAALQKMWDSAFLTRLEQFARRQNTTLFLVLLAVVRAHLFRSSGQGDSIIGVPATNRYESELENQIGFYVDTLALRQAIRPSDSFSALLKREQETFTEAFDHSRYPFDQLVSDLQIKRDASRTPLFQVFVQLHETAGTVGEPDDLQIAALPTVATPAKVDLTYGFTVDETGLRCSLIYSTDLFGQERAEALLTQLRCLAEAALSAPEKRIDRLAMLSEQERHSVLHSFNATQVPQSRASVVTLFEAWAERHAEAPAVIEEKTTFIYREVNAKANSIAHSLMQIGVGLESPVAVLLERSTDWVAAVLGILKARAVYVPIDPSYPRTRIEHILQDTGASVIVTTSRLAESLPRSAARVFCLDLEDLPIVSQNPSVGPDAGNIAYIIYTSGSTGLPKGVEVEHGGLANVIRDQITRLGVSREDRVLQMASTSFDMSIWELFVPLLAGACLVPIPRLTTHDVDEVQRFITENRVTLALVVPSFIRIIDPKRLASLRLLATGGEAATADISRAFARTRPCFNLYGPTEASIVATAHAVLPEKDYPFGIPIGRPISNYRCYVLDPAMNPMPIGGRGELFIGGEGVGRGYRNRPASTAAAFIPDPFSNDPGQRLYRTGDLVRWNAQGELEFMGRADHQAKIRGRRIELGEIETALDRLPGVREALALVRAGPDGQQRLVAYLVPENEKLKTTDLRKKLAETLPSGLMPDVFVQVADFKRNAAGKIDRDALPEPENGLVESGMTEDAEKTAPRTDIERVLAGIFSRVTGVQNVGIHDSFFDLGGNSLLATQALTRIRDRLRVEITVTDLFEAERVGELAARLLARAPLPERLEKIAAAIVKFENLSEEEQAEILAAARRAVDRGGERG